MILIRRLNLTMVREVDVQVPAEKVACELPGTAGESTITIRRNEVLRTPRVGIRFRNLAMENEVEVQDEEVLRTVKASWRKIELCKRNTGQRKNRTQGNGRTHDRVSALHHHRVLIRQRRVHRPVVG